MLKPIITLSLLGAVAGVTLGLVSSPQAAGDTRNDYVPPPASEPDRELEALSTRIDRLADALGAFEARLAFVETRPQADARTEVPDPSRQMTPDAIALVNAMSKGEARPEAFGEWFAEAQSERDARERAERAEAIESFFEGMLDDRLAALSEELGLAGYQTDEMRTILEDHMGEVASAMADASHPIEALQQVGPLRDERNAQIELILTPDQYSGFIELEQSQSPAMMFGRGPAPAGN